MSTSHVTPGSTPEKTETAAQAAAAMDPGAVRAMADRLHADPELGTHHSREDCEHLARRVLAVLGAQVRYGYGIRAENGHRAHASEEVARTAASEGYTLGSTQSPIVAGLTRAVVTFEQPLHGEWTDLDSEPGTPATSQTSPMETRAEEMP